MNTKALKYFRLMHTKLDDGTENLRNLLLLNCDFIYSSHLTKVFFVGNYLEVNGSCHWLLFKSCFDSSKLGGRSCVPCSLSE